MSLELQSKDYQSRSQENPLPITAIKSHELDLARVTLSGDKLSLWLESVTRGSSEFTVSDVHLHGVDMFGPKKNILGFAMAEVTATTKDHTGKEISIKQPVFVRGASACVLMRLHCEGQVYSLITVQPRSPTADQYLCEIPACIIDENNNLSGVFITDLSKQGFEISPDRLVDLTELAYSGNYCGMFPSPDLCDESMRVLLYEETLDANDLKGYKDSMTGILKDSSVLAMKIVRFDDLWRLSCDTKALASLALYEGLVDAGMIQQTTQSQVRKRRIQVYLGYDETSDPEVTEASKLYKSLSDKKYRLFPSQDPAIPCKFADYNYWDLHTTVYAVLISQKALDRVLKQDKNDRMLLEWELAVELKLARRLKEIIVWSADLVDLKKDLDSKGNKVSPTTKEKVRQVLKKSDLDPSNQFEKRTIKEVVEYLLNASHRPSKPQPEGSAPPKLQSEGSMNLPSPSSSPALISYTPVSASDVSAIINDKKLLG